MLIADAQRNMRYAYFGGGPGVLASALVWSSAGLVALTNSADASIMTLFIVGIFIHPAGLLMAKALRRPGAHDSGNPLGMLALEGTVLMLLCLPLVYGVSRAHLEWFFPAMLLVIGGRYLTFATIYGMRIYWACGSMLACAGFLLVMFRVPFAVGAFTGAAIEGVFAAWVFWTERKQRYGS